MVAADPIPTDMRTDIQRAAQGFASRVPLNDLMHKIDRHRKEKKQTIRKINQEYREDSSFKFEWGDFSGGIWDLLHIPDNTRARHNRSCTLEMLQTERRSSSRPPGAGRTRSHDTQDTGQSSGRHHRWTERDNSLRKSEYYANLYSYPSRLIGRSDNPNMCGGVEEATASPEKDSRRPPHTILHPTSPGNRILR